MAKHLATVHWQRGDQTFTDKRYSRVHSWHFDGGVSVKASPSPHVVPPPYSTEQAVDPEEAFVASLASCHMLFFLQLAAEQGYTVDEYRDEAAGRLAKNTSGRLAMTQVKLCPATAFSGERLPNRGEIEHLHHRAHELCFIANSVNTEIIVDLDAAEHTAAAPLGNAHD